MFFCIHCYVKISKKITVMVLTELIEIYNFLYNLSNKLENKLEQLDNNLKREEVLFNRYHVYPVFAHKVNPSNYKIYEPQLTSAFYFDANYFKNIGIDTCIYDKSNVDISIFTKVQTIYDLKTNRFSNRLPKKKAIYNFVYDYYDIPHFENKIMNILESTDKSKIFVFIITAGILQDIITSLILKYKESNCSFINQSIINLNRKLFSNIYLFLESYFDSEFWDVRNEYSLLLSFDIVIFDYEDSFEKRDPIYEVIKYGIKHITEHFTNKSIKREFKNIKFVQAVDMYIETDSENVNIIRSLFSVKNFADLIIADIICDQIHYI